MSHPKAVLTPVGRLILVRRIAQGRPAAHVASEMGVSRATAYKWWHRYVEEGDAGLLDRSSRPRRSPRRTPARVERQIVELRRRTKLGPIRIGVRLQMPAFDGASRVGAPALEPAELDGSSDRPGHPPLRA